MNSGRDRDPREDMPFLKRRWLLVVGLVVLLCVAVGVFLVWHANQPVEPKTVYVMPEPNPERAEILKRALQPPRRAYVPKTSSDEATTEDTGGESFDDTGGESSSQESEFEDDAIESMLAELDEETVEEKGDFPPVPNGFPSNLTPIWFTPGYKKGDEPEYESIYRVLIKLWNQGDYSFSAGAIANGRVYPIYPDMLYVEWDETTVEDGNGEPIPVRYIFKHHGGRPPRF